MRLLRVSFAAGVPGGSYFHSCGVCDFVGGFDCAGGQLFASGGGFAIRAGGRGIDATDLSGAVFIRVFLRRIHGIGGNHWSDPHALCGDANDGTDSLGGKARLILAAEGRVARQLRDIVGHELPVLRLRKQFSGAAYEGGVRGGVSLETVHHARRGRFLKSPALNQRKRGFDPLFPPLGRGLSWGRTSEKSKSSPTRNAIKFTTTKTCIYAPLSAGSHVAMSPLFQFSLRSTSDNPRTGPLRRQMSSFVVLFGGLGGAGPLFPGLNGADLGGK